MLGRKELVMMAGVLAVCMLTGGSYQVSAAEANRSPDSPNILFILTDDQGWSQLSKQMHPDIPDSRSTYLSTPHMNRLASEGMRFTSGYAPAPLCTPTRRSILCGTSAARSGTEFKSAFVPAEHMTIPQALKQANPAYRCAHFGKWGELMISTPEECGYDASDGPTGNVDGGTADRFKEFHIVNQDPKRTSTLTDRAIQFMRTQTKAGKPFYVQVSYYAVHLRVEVMEATLKKYRTKGKPDRAFTPPWAAMLEELDRGVGRLLNALDELKIAENTYVVFMSDNGGMEKIPGADLSLLPANHPLSGAKQSLLEGGIRVPFFVRGPGIKAGSCCHVPVAGYDLLPTFYDLAGGKEPLPDNIDGGSFRPLLTNPDKGMVKRPLDALVFHRPRKMMSAIRQDNHKLLIYWNHEGKFRSRELYNMKSDPGEKKNLATSDPGIADKMQATLTDYLGKVKAEKPEDVIRKKRAVKRKNK